MQIRLPLFLALTVPTFFLYAAPAAHAALTPDEQKIVAAVNAQVGTFARDLEQHVKLDSTTENLAGVRKLSDLYGAQLSALGLTYRFAALPAATGRAGHLIADIITGKPLIVDPSQFRPERLKTAAWGKVAEF